MGRRKGRSEAVQLWLVAKILVSMCRFPYIGKCCSEVSRAVGKDRNATWLRGAYQNSCLSLHVHQQCTYVKIRPVVWVSFRKRFRRLTYPITAERAPSNTAGSVVVRGFGDSCAKLLSNDSSNLKFMVDDFECRNCVNSVSKAWSVPKSL